MILHSKELMHIEGGSLSAAMLNAIIKGFEGIFHLGQSLGSALARLMNKNYCTR